MTDRIYMIHIAVRAAGDEEIEAVDWEEPARDAGLEVVSAHFHETAQRGRVAFVGVSGDRYCVVGPLVDDDDDDTFFNRVLAVVGEDESFGMIFGPLMDPARADALADPDGRERPEESMDFASIDDATSVGLVAGFGFDDGDAMFGPFTDQAAVNRFAAGYYGSDALTPTPVAQMYAPDAFIAALEAGVIVLA